MPLDSHALNSSGWRVALDGSLIVVEDIRFNCHLPVFIQRLCRWRRRCFIVKEDHNPTCVLASGASLDCGPARDLFIRSAENSDYAIILTNSHRCVLRGKVAKEHGAEDLIR